MQGNHDERTDKRQQPFCQETGSNLRTFRKRGPPEPRGLTEAWRNNIPLTTSGKTTYVGCEVERGEWHLTDAVPTEVRLRQVNGSDDMTNVEICQMARLSVIVGKPETDPGWKPPSGDRYRLAPSPGMASCDLWRRVALVAFMSAPRTMDTLSLHTMSVLSLALADKRT